jgi:hypothetical protein
MPNHPPVTTNDDNFLPPNERLNADGILRTNRRIENNHALYVYVTVFGLF